MKIFNPNILNEGNHMEVLEENDDEMEMILRCNNCGKPTKYGETRMCSGFVGCDNKIMVNGKEVECYFDDLMPRVLAYKEMYKESGFTDKDNLYHTGKVYRWRDKADGGLES